MNDQSNPLTEGSTQTYRSLTSSEISTLESNGCWAESWDNVGVAEDGFDPGYIHRVRFYSNIRIGKLQEDIEVTKGIFLSFRHQRRHTP